jgi:hypothetical protein
MRSLMTVIAWMHGSTRIHLSTFSVPDQSCNTLPLRPGFLRRDTQSITAPAPFLYHPHIDRKAPDVAAVWTRCIYKVRHALRKLALGE